MQHGCWDQLRQMLLSEANRSLDNAASAEEEPRDSPSPAVFPHHGKVGCFSF